MKHEMELKLQAYLDGELAEREAREVAAWITRDVEAQNLLAELKTTHGYLAGNEPVVAFPESREFYWSKIERAIERGGPVAAPAEGLPWWLQWRRYLVPAASIAAVVLVGLFALRQNPVAPASDEDSVDLAETEILSEDAGSFSFRSQKENMFVVWVYNREVEHSREIDSDEADEAVYQ